MSHHIYIYVTKREQSVFLKVCESRMGTVCGDLGTEGLP